MEARTQMSDTDPHIHVSRKVVEAVAPDGTGKAAQRHRDLATRFAA